jgi:hypothetical protein
MEAATANSGGPPGDRPVRLGFTGRLKRTGLIAAMALASTNVWTGSPLMALWVGSRVVGSSGQISMLAVAVVAVVMGAISISLIVLLGWLGDAYDRLTGRRRAVRQHLPWLRSMRGERPHEQPEGVRPSPLEMIVAGTVIVAVALFEIWFFFFSGSPIDQRSGRD